MPMNVAKTQVDDVPTRTDVGGIGGVIREFSNHQKMRGFSRNTIRRRRWTLERFAGKIEPSGLLAATQPEIEAFLAEQPTASTRQALLCDLRAFYRWAGRRGYLDADPTALTDPPRVPKRRPSPLTRTQLEEVMISADPRTRLIVMLAAYAGLRVAEIGALHSRDIDRQRGSLTVRQGKGGKDRVVPLAPALAAEMHEYGKNGYIIGMAPGSVSRCIRELFKELEIDQRPHDLRHTFGTEAARRSNGNLVVVAQLMGHESMTTTQRYVGWTPDAAAVIDGLYEPDPAA